MKSYTEVLINRVPGGHKWWRPDPKMVQSYYEARHKTEDIYALWMEAKLVSKRVTLPCVLCESGDVMVYGSGPEYYKGNSMVIKRWSLFFTPSNIETDYVVSTVDPEEFKAKYKAAKNGLLSLQGEILDAPAQAAEDGQDDLPPFIEDEDTEDEACEPEDTEQPN